MSAARMVRQACRIAWYLTGLTITLIACLSLAASMRGERATTVLLQGPFGFVSGVLEERAWVVDVRWVHLAFPIGWEADARHHVQASMLEDLREMTADDPETRGACIWHGPGLGFCYDPVAGVTYTIVYIEHQVVWLMAVAVLSVHVCRRFGRRRAGHRRGHINQPLSAASPAADNSQQAIGRVQENPDDAARL